MAQKLTIRFVETVRAKRQRTEHRDGYTRGLVLRVTPNGIKSWAVLYRRKSDGRKRRYTIGTYPEFSLADARTQAEAIVARVSRGEDPAAQVQARNAALTFEQLAETWIIRHGRPNKGARSLYDDQLMLKREINPAIGGMKADEVSKQNIISILEAVASRGARYRSNRVLALVRSIYRWGIAEDLIHSTGMASLGVNPHTISLVLDHISVTKGTVTGAVYVKYSFDREKRDALNAWAERLSLVLSNGGLRISEV